MCNGYRPIERPRKKLDFIFTFSIESGLTQRDAQQFLDMIYKRYGIRAVGFVVQGQHKAVEIYKIKYGRR